MVQVFIRVGGQQHHGVHGNAGSCTNSAQVSEEELKDYIDNLGADYFKKDTKGINDGFPILYWE